MNFIIALDKSDNTFIMCDEQGKKKIKINNDLFKKLNNKICTFDKNTIAVFNGDSLIKNSLTLLGKYYFGKEKDIKYLLCDATLHRKSMSKKDILNAYNNGVSFSNIRICSDNSIRMINGSIPFLNNLQYMRNNNTVIKIGNIKASTPGSMGVGKKFLGKRINDSKIGCVKFELFGGSYDINNEVLAYKLGKLLNFDVAEATIEESNGNKCVISIYNYNTLTESITSLKTEVGVERFNSTFNEQWMLKNKSKESWDKFIQMLMLDFIMHQTDRHISNIAFKGKEFYTLYDNGRALFYNDFYNEIKDIDLNNKGSIVQSFFTNEHGYGWLYLEDVLGYDSYKHLIKHSLTYEDFKQAVSETYSNKDKVRNAWVAEYMYKVYLIIIHQEKRWKQQ